MDMGKLEACFSGLDQASKEVLADLPTAQKKALGALLIAEDECGIPWLSGAEISSALQAAGTRLTAEQVRLALRNAGDKVSTEPRDRTTRYRIMIPGRREIEPALSRSALSVVYVEAGRPRTARQQLESLLSGLTGDVRINDPYYGIRILDSLALVRSATSVRFLTSKTNEKPADLTRAIADFRREHPTIELRKAADPKTMHDRYIVTDDTLILVGHGLKDIGGKESFVVRLEKALAEDLIATLVGAFDARWRLATPL